jgi:hypothetical protein
MRESAVSSGCGCGVAKVMLERKSRHRANQAFSGLDGSRNMVLVLRLPSQLRHPADLQDQAQVVLASCRRVARV